MTKEIPPSWISDGIDVKYSDKLYICGLGVSEKKSEVADEIALNNIIKKIEGRILNWESSFLIDDSEKVKVCFLTNNGSRTEQDKSLTFYMDLLKSSLNIEQRWYDEKVKRHYSLAIVNRNIYSEKLKDLIRKKIEDINVFYLSGLKNEEERFFDKSLISYKEASIKRRELDKLLQLYKVIKISNEKDCYMIELNPKDMPPSLSSIQESFERLIRGINIISFDGNNQIGHPGYPLPKQLCVKVVFMENKGCDVQYPVANIPVKFSFDSSTGELDSVVKTDKDGIARSKVYKVNMSKNKINTISAIINLKGFPESKKGVFLYHLLAPISKDLKAYYNWQEGITKLSDELISKINAEKITRLTLMNFLDLKSGKVSGLSKMLKSELINILSDIEDLTVVSSDNEKFIELNAQTIRSKTDFFVAGLYWLEDKSLKIVTKLVDTDRNSILAMIEINILKEAINNNDINSIVNTEQDDSFELPYNSLVDKMYLYKEEKRISNIEIWTDKKEYGLGDLLTIYIKSDIDCYLYLFQIKANSIVYQLFPNSIQKNNFINANKITSISYDYMGSKLNVTGPVGIERIKAIAFVKPFHPIEKNTFQGTYSFDEENIKSLLSILQKNDGETSPIWIQDFTYYRIYWQDINQTKSKLNIRQLDDPEMPIDIIGTID